MKRYDLENDYGGGSMEEHPEGDYVKFEDVQPLIEALKKAQWMQDHILGKEKRVDWGKTFDINWMGINETLMATDDALKKAGIE